MRLSWLAGWMVLGLGSLACASGSARDVAAPESPAAAEAAMGPSGGVPGAPMAAAPAAVAGEAKPAAPRAVAEGGVRAGEWDDNANYREFSRYIEQQSNIEQVSTARRRFLVVSDDQGKPVPNCKVAVSDANQRRVELVTTASGRAILFPEAEGLARGKLVATASCHGATARAQIPGDEPDGATRLALGTPRKLPAKRTVDLAFVLDTTGSMSEEISAVKSTIREVSAKLDGRDLDVRVGLVEYKDRTDEVVTRVYPMTSDLRAFETEVSRLSALGGGDMPEAMNEGLHAALTKLSWSPSSVARVAFVIADAPPHLDYENDVSYTTSMKSASRRGIKLYTVAASGMDEQGQAVFRQLAQYTGGSSLFVLRGGAGPQSTGGGDPRSSCGGTHENYTSANLDALIVAKIRAELSSLDGDAMRIAGLGKDENAKPCSERLTVAR